MRHGAGLLLHRRWQEARRAALERDGYRCRSCGKAGVLQVDHIQPLHVGGEPYGLENLQSLCVECHWNKSWAERGGTPDQLAWRRYQRKVDAKEAKQ